MFEKQKDEFDKAFEGFGQELWEKNRSKVIATLISTVVLFIILSNPDALDKAAEVANDIASTVDYRASMMTSK